MIKKLCALLLASLMCVLILTGCGNKKTDTPKGMKLASAEEADYTMYVPKDWRVDKSTLYTAAYYSSEDATSISATAYGMNYTDKSVDDWFDGFTKEMKDVYKNVSNAETESLKLGGNDAKKFSFSAELNGQSYYYIVTATIHQNYIYYITYTSTPEFYEKHLEELNDVIDNFSFKK